MNARRQPGMTIQDRATGAGFTLLEILAALALLSLLLLGVFSGIRTATRTLERGQAAVARMDGLRATQQFLRRELMQALPMMFARNRDGEGVVFHGQAREMRYVAPLPGYLGRLGPQLQTLRLVPDGDSLRLEVDFSLLPPDGSQPQSMGKPQVLMRGIREGHFEYRGYDAKQAVLPWQPAWADATGMPSLVRITLELHHGAWPVLEVPLRVDASAVSNSALPAMGMRGSLQ